jgi:hypothetical protein
MALLNITNNNGLAGVKAFIVSNTGYDSCSESKTSDFALTLYHTGVGTLPTIGDEIWKNKEGTIRWTSIDEPQDRQIQSSGANLKVNSLGVQITTC